MLIVKQKDSAAAVEICELGRQHFPYNSDWWKGISAAAKLSGDNDRRREALKTLTMIEQDDPSPRKSLAEMALADHNFDDALKYAKMALHIDVLDADIHRYLGEAFLGVKQFPRAIAEFETALELKPKDVSLQLGLAEAFLLSDRKAEANKLIDDVLTKDAGNERAKKQKERIKQ